MAAKKCVALLRGVNVGGNNRVSMPKLREALTAGGYESVQTLLNSGNVVLTASGPGAAVEKAVASAIKSEFGLTIAVMVRSHQQLAAAIKHNPFPEHIDAGNYLMCGFFNTTPSKTGAAGLDPEKYAPDEYRIVGDEIYLWYPNGSGRSKLNLPAIEKAVGAIATVRNWNTVAKLAALTAA